MEKKDIEEIIKAGIGALDLSKFKGDLVMYKHVDKELNIAEGGIGEQHIHHHYPNAAANEAAAEAKAPAVSADKVSVPPELDTPEARILWKRAQEGGLVDANLQPLIPQKKAVIMASIFVYELNLVPKWPPFEKLWNYSDISTLLSKAMSNQYYDQCSREYEKMLLKR